MTETKKEETWQEREARHAKEFRDNHLPEFFKTMKENDIKYFTVDFSGGGDDGSVESPVYAKDAEIPSWSSIRLEAGISDQMKWDDPDYQRLEKKLVLCINITRIQMTLAVSMYGDNYNGISHLEDTIWMSTLMSLYVCICLLRVSIGITMMVALVRLHLRMENLMLMVRLITKVKRDLSFKNLR